MSEIFSLETLQKFLYEKVALQVKYKIPSDKNVIDYKLTNPKVHIGWIPTNGYFPKELGSSIPCILVGHDGGEDDGEEASLNIRLSFVIWNPGCKNNEGIVTPDFEGYRDVVNFIERTKMELLKQKIINKKITINTPLKWGMYDENPYPYWYGWMTFKIRIEPIKYLDNGYNEFLK